MKTYFLIKKDNGGVSYKRRTSFYMINIIVKIKMLKVVLKEN